MRRLDLIKKISSKNVVPRTKGMQVLDEQSEAYFNFINSLQSEATKESYKFCLEKFLNHYRIDLLSFLKLPQPEITNLIIKYLVDKKISKQYKSVIMAALKHACEINDIVLNWKKIKKFINFKKTGNETNGRDRGYTEMVLKNTWIKVFPTNSIKAARGYMDVAWIWADESSFFPESVQEELIHVLEPYQTKSNAKILLSSTPFRPADMMQKIELDKASKYFKLKLPYTYGLDTIYNRAEIEKKKNDIEFEREFNCKYTGLIGNLITADQLTTCQELGNEYSTDKIPVSLYTLKSVGIDPGFSSSATGIVVLEHIKQDRDIIRIIKSHLIEKGDPNKITELCWEIWKKHNWMNTFFFIDGSNRAMVNLLKIRWNESLSWENTQVFGNNIKIRPVNFSTEHKNMLSNLHAIISKGYLAVDPKHDKLLTSLRTAYAEELNLKKEQTSYDDLFDALRLALKGYNIE